jgi:Mn2+/Fe2+ NRAMP family transporter
MQSFVAGMCLVKLINDKNLMGSYTNKPAFNIIAGITVVTMIALTVVMTMDFIFPVIIKRLLSF